MPVLLEPAGALKAAQERDTAFWRNLITEAAELGVLQLHFSGGEPTLRDDLVELVAHATASGIYTNLITSAVLLDAAKLHALEAAGLGHVQISIQGANAQSADRIGKYRNGHAKKLAIAKLVSASEMSLTINAVVHRQNLHELPEMIDLAEELGADRLEIAHVQYHGWALRNRSALMPARDALREADALVAERRDMLRGKMAIDYVIPDYYADTPKSCMGGWGQKIFIVAPDGRVLPCHAADTIPGLVFERAGDRPLSEIWQTGPAFQAYRGTEWMQEPCRSCSMKEIDFGGCRCQALALAGDAKATDPACQLSANHRRIQSIAEAEAASSVGEYIYRRFAQERA